MDNGFVELNMIGGFGLSRKYIFEQNTSFICSNSSQVFPERLLFWPWDEQWYSVTFFGGVGAFSNVITFLLLKYQKSPKLRV
jgi:hypothetical protein